MILCCHIKPQKLMNIFNILMAFGALFKSCNKNDSLPDRSPETKISVVAYLEIDLTNVCCSFVYVCKCNKLQIATIFQWQFTTSYFKIPFLDEINEMLLVNISYMLKLDHLLPKRVSSNVKINITFSFMNTL